MGQAGRLRQLGRSNGALDHRLDHDVPGVFRLGQARVRVHQLRQDRLIQRAPVYADPDRLVVLDGDADDLGEVIVVMAPGPTLPGLMRYLASARAAAG